MDTDKTRKKQNYWIMKTKFIYLFLPVSILLFFHIRVHPCVSVVSNSVQLP